MGIQFFMKNGTDKTGYSIFHEKWEQSPISWIWNYKYEVTFLLLKHLLHANISIEYWFFFLRRYIKYSNNKLVKNYINMNEWSLLTQLCHLNTIFYTLPLRIKYLLSGLQFFYYKLSKMYPKFFFPAEWFCKCSYYPTSFSCLENQYGRKIDLC